MDVPRHELARLLAHSGYLAWTATLIGEAPPWTRRVYNRMRYPGVGDLVLETSTYHREPWDPGGLGYLRRTAMEPVGAPEDWDEAEVPLEQVWYVEPFVPTEDGRTEVRWHNADFIALPDRLRWMIPAFVESQ